MAPVLALVDVRVENVITASANILSTTIWIRLQILPECLE